MLCGALTGVVCALLSAGADADASRPTPQPGAGQRLAPSVAVGEPADGFVFRSTQPGGVTPVGYDPCRPLRVAVNPAGAPDGYREVVVDALDAVTTAAGLTYELTETDEQPLMDRQSFQPDRYGDRWAPALIAWSSPEQIPDLAGRVGGIAGSDRVDIDGEFWYVTGRVYLDGPQLDGRPHALMTVLHHELGHMLGLDHVDDPDQLMYFSATRARSFQPGDVAGLAAIGAISCAPPH